eukprot:12756520-Prorocentrum_lima.AAC.1
MTSSLVGSEMCIRDRFYPLVTFVLLLICIAYWAMTALYPLPTQPATPVSYTHLTLPTICSV